MSDATTQTQSRRLFFFRYSLLLLLLPLSHISHVQLCATPKTAAHQAPPSLGFSRQEHWSGLPFLLQFMKVKSESELAQSCPTPSDPMDCSAPGSSVHGIFQARVLEWGAIAFSLFLAKVLQISFRELFLKNNYDFILEAFNVNDIPKISSLAIHFNFLP